MDTITSVGFASWIAFASIFLVLFLTRMFARARHPDWKIHEIELKPVQWAIVLGIYGLLLGAAKFVTSEATERSIRASIPATDRSRFSFLVADFQGEGGREAADLIARELQRSLGSGIQVIRVPLRGIQPAYGDVSLQRAPAAERSLICARDYDGDVVVWGSYHRDGQLVEISTTAAGGPCQPHCGITQPREPRALPLAELSARTSEVRSEVLGSIAAAVMMPIQSGFMPGLSGECASRPDVAQIFVRKITRFLEGTPTDLPHSTMAQVYLSLAVYETTLARTQHDTGHLRRARDHLERIERTYPAEWPPVIAVYADVLAIEAELSTSLEERRALAERATPLNPSDEPNLISATSEAKGRLWALVYDISGAEMDFARSAHWYDNAASIDADEPVWTFGLENTLTMLWADRAEQTQTHAALVRAREYGMQADGHYFAFPLMERQSLPQEARIRYFLAQLRLARLGDPRDALRSISRVQLDGILRVWAWDDPLYAQLQLAYGAAFRRIYELTRDRRFALSSIGATDLVLENTPLRSIAQATARFDSAMVHGSLYFYSGDEAARARAVQDFGLSATIYRQIGEHEAATVATQWAQRLPTIRPRSSSSQDGGPSYEIWSRPRRSLIPMR